MKKDIEQQFLQIWNDYHDEIYRYVISMLSDTGEAEECTQDVFLILWKLMQERTMYNPRYGYTKQQIIRHCKGD